MEDEDGVTRTFIDELHSSDMIKWKVKVMFLEVSLMKFILGVSNKIKWKMNVVLLKVSLLNFILRI